MKLLQFREASEDTALLVVAGQRKSPVNPKLTIDSPSCYSGEQCVGITAGLFGTDSVTPKGSVMMSWMPKNERIEHETTGRQPSNRYACVLCQWNLISHIYDNVMASFKEWPADLLIQWFRVAMDVEGGYKREFCHDPNPHKFRGLIAPVPKFRCDALFFYRDKQNTRRIDHTRMLFQNAEATSR
jgi:hypothetical protein